MLHRSASGRMRNHIDRPVQKLRLLELNGEYSRVQIMHLAQVVMKMARERAKASGELAEQYKRGGLAEASCGGGTTRGAEEEAAQGGGQEKSCAASSVLRR